MATTEFSIGVLLVEDDADLRGLLAERLGAWPELEVSARLASTEGLADRVREHRPHVVILHLAGGTPERLRCVTELREAFPDLGVLVYSGLPGISAAAGEALARGADAYMEKGEPIQLLRDAVLEIALCHGAADRRTGADRRHGPCRRDGADRRRDLRLPRHLRRRT